MHVTVLYKQEAIDEFLDSMGISDLLDTDMEESTNFIDENSILSSASEGPSRAPKTKPSKTKATKSRVTKLKTAASKTKATSPAAAKKQTKRVTGAKRKALVEHVNGQIATNEKVDDVSEDELDSPKTLVDARREPSQKSKVARAKKPAAKKDVPEQEQEIDQTPLVARSSNFATASRKELPKVTKAPAQSKSAKSHSRPAVPETQPEPMEAETDGNDQSEIAPLPQARQRPRPEPRSRQTSATRRRAGSASDAERGDPNLRRKLGDITRKFENIDLKYRNLKDVGVNEANSNMEKLRKQCDATTAASAELIASLKRELAAQIPLAQESRKLQKTLAAKEIETRELHTHISELSASLTATQNEIKALQAKLAASRNASVAVESVNGKTPKNAKDQVRTIMVGSAEAAQAAQVAQLKEELYSDLTGLIVRSVKRTEEGYTYDCIQTGRNGSKCSSPNYACSSLTQSQLSTSSSLSQSRLGKANKRLSRRPSSCTRHCWMLTGTEI